LVLLGNFEPIWSLNLVNVRICPFNQILLSLFDVPNTFYYNILVCLHRLTRVRFKCWLKNAFEMSNKLKKNWFKGLNSHVSKYK